MLFALPDSYDVRLKHNTCFVKRCDILVDKMQDESGGTQVYKADGMRSHSLCRLQHLIVPQ